MGQEQNKAVVAALYEGLNQRDWSVFDELLATDYVHLSSGEYRVDREGLKVGIINNFLKAFPDLHVTLDEMIAEGDKVMARWTQQGTHLGPFLDKPATGKFVTYSGINIFRLANGRIVEDTPYWDFRVLLEQIDG
jgi:steroid delta-isomerase-like uncharacterized protein